MTTSITTGLAVCPSLLRFDFVEVSAGPSRRRPARPNALARNAQRFVGALADAMPESDGDLGAAIAALKMLADEKIMGLRRRARR